MNATTRLVIVIKWFGLVMGAISYLSIPFIISGYFEVALMMDLIFLIWFVPTWAIGWIFKGYKSIMPYPYPMKKDGEDYFEISEGFLILVLVFPFVMALLLTIWDKFFG